MHAVLALGSLVVSSASIAEGFQCNGRLATGYIVSSGALVTGRGEWVAQARCLYETDDGAYGGVSVSQSLENPGLSKTSGNEVTYIGGLKFAVLDTVRVNVFVQYWDLANRRVLDGTNGDMVNPGLNLSFTPGNFRYYV